MFSFTMFVLQWVTDQLDEPFGSSGSPPFSVFNIVFTLFLRQIKYDNDDEAALGTPSTQTIMALVLQRVTNFAVCEALSEIIQ